MILVDSDVTSDTVNFYMMWIVCMLRKTESITLVGVVYTVYID